MQQSNGSTIGALLENPLNKTAWFVYFLEPNSSNFIVFYFFIYNLSLLISYFVVSIKQREDFWNEAIKLADLHHPNVVAFYGVVIDGPGDNVATVTEYMVNGSLRNALQKNER